MHSSRIGRGNIRSILGDGNDIAFWKDKWVMTSLRELFPTHFAKSLHPDNCVSTTGSWDRDQWAWNIEWTTALSETESETTHDLLLLLDQFRLCRDDNDRWRWLAHETDFFTVKTAYKSLLNSLDLPEIDTATVNALKSLWLNNVPSKVSIFGWKLMLEKLPTGEALFNKGIITNNHDRCCVFCFKENEDINHIFFKCSISVEVWRTIFRWMGLKDIPFLNICNHFTLFGESLKETNNKRSRHIIWLATTWCLWRKRNNILFRGEFVNVSSVVEQILHIAWFWLIGREMSNANVLFSDWCKNHLDCFR
jgi:hypothetical protein